MQLEQLTETERRVVDLVCEGLSNPQIGQRLFISRRTVQWHLGNVFRKLGVTSRTQLVAAILRHFETPAEPPDRRDIQATWLAGYRNDAVKQESDHWKRSD